jgi:hypothetical protein
VAFFCAVLFIRQSRVSSGKSNRLAHFFSQQYEKSVKFYGEKRKLPEEMVQTSEEKIMLIIVCNQSSGEICKFANFSVQPSGDSGQPYGETVQPYGEKNKLYGRIVQPYGEKIMFSGDSVQPYAESVEPYGEKKKLPGETVQPYGEMSKPSGEICKFAGETV